jgi:formylglycine-generating enzyme required for sulfatase activity
MAMLAATLALAACDHASGDDSGACFANYIILGGLGISTVFGNYAVYSENSGLSTAPVKSKIPNALGLYDMSGNVAEWLVDAGPSSARRIRSGCWYGSAAFLQVGYGSDVADPHVSFPSIGFRIAKRR